LKTVAIIQARMSSSRLPGKVLMHVKKKPLLLYMYERVKASNEIDEVIIATSNEESDDVIVKLCKENNIMYMRGSLNDVLDRYYQAAKITNASLVVRLTADCPIIDPSVIDSIIGVYKNGAYDFVANTAPPEGMTYPEGMDVEVFSMLALENAWNYATKPSEREHVTFYFWKNIDKFKCFRADLTYNRSNYRLTVDYFEDFLLVSKILEALYSEDKFFSMNDILEFLDQNPDIFQINNKIESFSGWEASLMKDLENKL
jgi:spore coat polysaccharide biosynthesis protein SpsF (cytidylyltransferase family)